jgi:hypothetical protein
MENRKNQFFIYISFVFLILSLTTPFKSHPWGSIYNESFSIFFSILLIISAQQKTISLNPIIYFITITICTIFLHFFITKQFFHQSTAIGISYLLLSIGIINVFNKENSDTLLFLTCLSIITAGIINVIFQTHQLLGFDDFIIINKLYGNRPYGNIGQANHLGTLLATAIGCITILFNKKIINLFQTYFLGLIFIAGITFTDSRTAFLSIIAMTLATFAFKNLRVIAKKLYLPFLASAISLKYLAINLEKQRSLTDSNFSSFRIDAWNMLFDAAAKKPWLGYGFNRTIAAQFETIQNYPSLWGMHFSHAHNIIIDFLIWFGLPISISLFFILSIIFYKKIIAINSQTEANCIITIMPLAIHALLEYPLNYFYFIAIASLFLGYLFKNEFSRKTKIPTLLILTISSLVCGIAFIEYKKSNSILELQVQQIKQSTEKDQEPIKNIIMDEMGSHANSFKKYESMSSLDFLLLEDLIKSNPVEINLNKLIKYYSDNKIQEKEEKIKEISKIYLSKE